MASVTKRVKTVLQPEGGYLPVSRFAYKKHNNSGGVYNCESIGKDLVLSAVECLVNIYFSKNPEKNFSVLESALLDVPGAEKKEIIAKFYNGINCEKPTTAARYAVKLARFESYYRSGIMPECTEPERLCLESIHKMAEECKEFFSFSVKLCGFDFEGGYSSVINSGSGGYLTDDALWNITLSKPSQYDTLLILVQYIMGLHSYRNRTFAKLKTLGIYNPLLCEQYTISISDISEELIKKISNDVICYE